MHAARRVDEPVDQRGMQIGPRRQRRDRRRHDDRLRRAPRGVVERRGGQRDPADIGQAPLQRLDVANAGEPHCLRRQQRRQVRRIDGRHENSDVDLLRQQRLGRRPAPKRAQRRLRHVEPQGLQRVQHRGAGAAALRADRHAPPGPGRRIRRAGRMGALEQQERLLKNGRERLDRRVVGRRDPALQQRRVDRARGDQRRVLDRSRGLDDLQRQTVAREQRAIALGDGVIGAAGRAGGHAHRLRRDQVEREEDAGQQRRSDDDRRGGEPKARPVPAHASPPVFASTGAIILTAPPVGKMQSRGAGAPDRRVRRHHAAARTPRLIAHPASAAPRQAVTFAL
jgi:hypothetical protein